MRRSQASAVGSGQNRRTDLGGHDGAEPSKPSRQGFMVAYRNFTDEIDLTALALDPGELFESIRKEAQGRDIRL